MATAAGQAPAAPVPLPATPPSDSPATAPTATANPEETGLPAPAAPSPSMAVSAASLEASCNEAIGKGKFKPIIDACTAAFGANPSASLAVRVAQNALERGRKNEAVDWARRAIATDAGFADAYVFLGGAQQELGRRAEAKAAYEKYLELAPAGKYAGDLRALVRGL